MSKRYLLGIDCGTYETKATLCDPEGRVLTIASAKYELRVPQKDYAEHDPIEDWWEALKDVVGQVLSKSKVRADEIAGICVSTIMAAITPVDAHGNPLRNAILYGIDRRSQPQADKLNSLIGEQKMREISGTMCTVESFGPKILWIRENEPEIFEKTKCFTIAAGFINHKLTGRFCVDRYSATSAQPMIDVNTMTWSKELTPYVCREDQLPEILWTTDIIGEVTKEAALETGLHAGTPVLCGTTDGGSDAISVGIVEPGDCMINYGSTLFMSYLGQPSSQQALWAGEYVLPGIRCMTAGMATAGSLTRWLRDQFAKELLRDEEAGLMDAYTALFQEIESIPAGADGLIVLPYFMGERMPIQDAHAKGVIFGLNLYHTRGHVLKASLEGIAYGLDQILDILREKGHSIRQITAVGGGTKSQPWMQTMSDVCGVRHVVPQVTIGASYGDALLAGLGTGLIKQPSDIKAMINQRYTTEPNPKNHEIYAPLKQYFAQIYQRNKDIMHAL